MEENKIGKLHIDIEIDLRIHDLYLVKQKRELNYILFPSTEKILLKKNIQTERRERKQGLLTIRKHELKYADKVVGFSEKCFEKII